MWEFVVQVVLTVTVNQTSNDVCLHIPVDTYTYSVSLYVMLQLEI